MDKNDGGPAFPDPVRADASAVIPAEAGLGMSLRDYFAAHVLPVLSEAHAVDYRLHNGHDREAREMAEDIADAAYLIADAMLEARKA